MFGRKCTLCGGKLDGRGRCEECGLDSSKSEKRYKINQSSCDGEPLTHVHREDYHIPRGDEQKRKKEQSMSGGQRMENRQPEYRYHDDAAQRRMSKRERDKDQNKSVAGRIVAVITIVLTVAGIVLSVIEEHGPEISSWADTEFGESESAAVSEEYQYDPYEYVEKMIPETGESTEYVLSTGHYIVGIHIQEGNYAAETQDTFDTVQVHDNVNGIYLFEYEDKEDNCLDDLRMYQGAIVTVGCEDTVTLKTDNGQTGLMLQGMTNPLSETVAIGSGEEKTAGMDFEPGIYDIIASGEIGIVDIVVYDEEGEKIKSFSVYLGEDSGNGKGYKYMVLPEKTTIACNDGVALSLLPAETIASEDYLGFYEDLY